MLSARRGQANVITLMILISVTIALALMLYAYFSGAYARQSLVEQRVQLVATYSDNIWVNIETFSNATDSNVTGTSYVYCGVFTLSNRGGSTLRPTITILPGAPEADGLFHPSRAISRFPIDYSSLPLKRGLLVWLLKDQDTDGIVDMLAGQPDGPYRIVLNRTASCLEIYSNSTLKLPQNSLYPTNIQAKDIILDPVSELDLLTLVKKVYPAANQSFYVPAWPFTLDPGESATIYFYAESPVPLRSLTLVVTAPYENVYLASGYSVFWSS